MALRKAKDRTSISNQDQPSPASPCKHPTISHHSGYRLSIDVYTECRNQFTTEARPHPSAQLYTPEERRRRDASPWTLVQGVLAPIQFVVFLVSLVLVIRFLATGDGFVAATVSIVIKTFVLYAIMITGSIWEREVFGIYLFARPFFWEDVFSILVLALHTLYLAGLVTGALSPQQQMLVALAAYATYVVNATQFLLKLRAARREQPAPPAGTLELAQ
jgi:3-vinyl bacteriochlorophyllide hydratase